MLREMIRENRLPDYVLSEEAGDILRTAVLKPGEGLHLRPETLDHARTLVPGADIHALQAEQGNWWVGTGRPRRHSADKAFLGWVGTRT